MESITFFLINMLKKVLYKANESLYNLILQKKKSNMRLGK